MKIIGVALKIGEDLYFASRPARHDTMINMAFKDGHPAPVGGVQGFLTDTGQFVDREEAASIAQTHMGITLQWPPLLYSEDLW
jgi:hypothetical protein